MAKKFVRTLMDLPVEPPLSGLRAFSVSAMGAGFLAAIGWVGLVFRVAIELVGLLLCVVGGRREEESGQRKKKRETVGS